MRKKEYLKKLVEKHGVEGAKEFLKKKLKSSKKVEEFVLKAKVNKSGFFKPEYYIDIPITSSNFDSHNQRLDGELLKKLSKSGEVGGYWSSIHRQPKDAFDFTLKEYWIDGSVLKARAYVNKDSSDYKSVISALRTAPRIGVSVELDDVLMSDDESLIYDATLSGFIVTDNAAVANLDAIF